MTPSQQYVALGTIGRSKLGAASTSCTGSPMGSSLKALSEPWDDKYPAQEGSWIPVSFSNDYVTSGTTNTNATSTLVNAVECLNNSSGTGTYLASPMKAAARYLLGNDPNNLGSLPVRTDTIRKAIIFETDGAPNESIATGGDTARNVAGDISSTATSTDAACNNLKDVAANAKAAGILVVTVGFNLANIVTGQAKPDQVVPETCGGGSKVVDVLAAAASDKSPGVPSAANFDCSTTAGRNAENSDGDFFFCGGSGTDMAPIFKTAFGKLSRATG